MLNQKIQESFSLLGIEMTADEDAIRKAYRAKLCFNNPEDNPEGYMELRKAYETAISYVKSAGDTEEAYIRTLWGKEQDWTPWEDEKITIEDFKVWDSRQNQCLENGDLGQVLDIFFTIQPLFPEKISIYERAAQVLLLDYAPDELVQEFVSMAQSNGLDSRRLTLLRLRCMRLLAEQSPKADQIDSDSGEEAVSREELIEEACCFAEVLLLEWQEEEAEAEFLSGLMAELALLLMLGERYGEAMERILGAIELVPLPVYATFYGYIEVEEQRKKHHLSGFYNVQHMTGTYDLHASFCMSLARLYQARGDYEKAAFYFRKVWEEYPVGGRLSGTIGALYYKMTERQDNPFLEAEALKLLSHQVEKCFVKAPFYLVRSRLYLRQKAYAQAYKDVDAVLLNKKEVKLHPEAYFLKAEIVLAKRAGTEGKAGYYLEKAYDLSCKTALRLSAAEWVDTTLLRLKEECDGAAFSYWSILLDNITELFRDMILRFKIISMGEKCGKKEDWQKRNQKEQQSAKDMCEALYLQFEALESDPAQCPESLLHNAPEYALKRMEPEEQEWIKRIMQGEEK